VSTVEQSRLALRSNLKDGNLDRHSSPRFSFVNCCGECLAVWRNTQSAQVNYALDSVVQVVSIFEKGEKMTQAYDIAESFLHPLGKTPASLWGGFLP
jgi:hypothetical protein